MRISSIFAFAAYFYTTVAWKTFIVPHSPGKDDTPALLAALPNLAVNSSIVFAKGTTYNIFTPIKFPVFTNVEIVIEGNLTYPTDIPTIQATVASSSFPGHWIFFSGGNNVTLRGTTDPRWGWIDGHGQAWWDGQILDNRPHGVNFGKITNGVIRDIKIWKPVAWNFATSGSTNLHAFNNQIHALSDNNNSFPFNTYGFSAGGTNMLFERNTIQNGDDCLTVGNGAKDIVFRDSYCEGGHGLSIGSLGKGGQVADVQNVLIENVTMYNTLYGARFKSWTGGNGLARNITWRNITFSDVPFPIYVTQNYWDQNVGPKPNTTSPNNTHIQDFLFENFMGVIKDTPYVEGSCVTDPCWYFVANATGKEVAIFDLYPNTTSNILTRDIFAKTQTGAPVDVMCDPTTITNDIGFKCWDGQFIRTTTGL
ncbi:glycoside hydrolase family 28 protein [Macrolepiota fuliginosa MF-IS2]|uniref:galacturonan 1,4-alpha-galacturonidase n=1 Tax=Macrolepiota fuliginosa MF-IS2 TaxID=1400762 RepID=A0A9P5XI50_9AGAR|nr:glycoside hydrolase family 28 protein [Macrolepiota fuliginosa MF-IS2]